MEGGLAKLVTELKNQLTAQLTEGVRGAVSVFLILLLCGLLETGVGPEHSGVITLAGTAAISARTAAEIGSLAALGREVIDTMSDFSKRLLLSLAAASGTVGMPAAASAKYAMAMLAGELFLTAVERLLLPLLCAYLAAQAANAAVGENLLGGMAAMIRRICTLVLAGMLTLFTALLGISGLVAGGADAATMKTAKLLISNAVPVVGGILSDAAESVISAARIVRNAAGLLGLFAVASVCLGPFLRFSLRTLLLRMAGAAAGPVAPGRLCALVTGLADAFGILAGMVGACALMNLISIVSFMRLTGVW